MALNEEQKFGKSAPSMKQKVGYLKSKNISY